MPPEYPARLRGTLIFYVFPSGVFRILRPPDFEENEPQCSRQGYFSKLSRLEESDLKLANCRLKFKSSAVCSGCRGESQGAREIIIEGR